MVDHPSSVPILRDISDATVDRPGDFSGRQQATPDGDAAGRRLQQTDDGIAEMRLAGACEPRDADRLACANREGYVAEHAVEGKVLDIEHDLLAPGW
jgi:hypothetical protein